MRIFCKIAKLPKKTNEANYNIIFIIYINSSL